MKIALLGTAPSSLRMAPMGDESWTIWACSPGCAGLLPTLPDYRVDAWFELHDWTEPTNDKEYKKFLAQFPNPVYLIEARSDVPSSITFPRQEMVDRFGPYFFTSTLAWMMALAISLEPEEIGFWGVDMCVSPETRVLTSDLRWVQAGDVSVGDKLIAFDEEPRKDVGGAFGKRRWQLATVERAEQLTRPCYRVHMADGTELVSSAEHRWLTHAEHHCRWRRTDQLSTRFHRKDRPSKIVKLCNVWDEDKSWEAGYLAAAFDGEGHLSQKLREGHYGLLRAGFAQRDNPMSAEVISICAQMGFDLKRDHTGGRNGDTGKYSIRGGRMASMEFLGRIRPRRLMAKFNPEHLGLLHKIEKVAVTGTEYIGEQPVIGLKTSTGTFVAEGFASHNSANEEYGTQRPGCHHFIDLAQRDGIKIYAPAQSDLLCPPPQYGYTSHMRTKLQARRAEIAGRVAEATKRRDAAVNEIAFLSGALEDIDYTLNTWT